MRNKKGFTLAEIMTVLVILSVVAGLAVPGYFRTVEQSRSNEARTNLNIILMGQKIYRINNATYWSGGNLALDAQANLDTINNTLNIDLSSARFYTALSFTGVSAAGYTATLTRNNQNGGNGADFIQHVFTTGAPLVCNGQFFGVATNGC